MTKVETESKYVCSNKNYIIKRALELGFKELKPITEEDEYFTDINSEFIKNRTCLRIRKTNNKKMELTYKGKSEGIFGDYSKHENNVKINIKEYYNTVEFLFNLGYYSYVIVTKKRRTFNYNDDNYEYNIMIDTLPGIGDYVEFEILSETKNKEELFKDLRNFESKFDINDTEMEVPYRDIVASSLMDKYVIDNKVSINIDDSISEYLSMDISSIVYTNNYIRTIIELLNRTRYDVVFNTNLDKELMTKYLKESGLTKDFSFDMPISNVSDDLKKIINLLLIIDNN